MNTRQRRNAVTFIIGGSLGALILGGYTLVMAVHLGAFH